MRCSFFSPCVLSDNLVLLVYQVTSDEELTSPTLTNYNHYITITICIHQIYITIYITKHNHIYIVIFVTIIYVFIYRYQTSKNNEGRTLEPTWVIAALYLDPKGSSERTHLQGHDPDEAGEHGAR